MDFIRERNGIVFWDACAVLGLNGSDYSYTPVERTPRAPETVAAPNADWQAAMLAFVDTQHGEPLRAILIV